MRSVSRGKVPKGAEGKGEGVFLLSLRPSRERLGYEKEKKGMSC